MRILGRRVARCVRAVRVPGGARALHQLPPAPEALAEGCEPFLSKRTTGLLWTQWHAGLLQRLNEEVKGTPRATESVVETVVNTARDRSEILAFSHASLALNNSFFLASLCPRTQQANREHPQPSTHMGAVPTFYGKTLATAISEQYGSLPQLKLAFSAAAMGMFSSGYVWLVKDEHGRLGIVPTYGAGTVLVQQRQQRGAADLVAGVQDGRASKDAPPHAAPPAAAPPPPARAPSRFDSLAQSSAAGAIGNNLYPLFCVSVFEHAWLGDYGFWGKERYLTNLWDCLNWARIEMRWGEDRM
ncbi:superoxide dismutase [Malassezia sp. CBS 17886]|nr:superoxide dismutase [Malassezia sp. CBS 17886]